MTNLASSKMPHAEIRPGWWLSAGRALYLDAERTLVIADIHWGYALSHRRAGNLLPLWGDPETAQRLGRLLESYQPARMIWLGDSLHTAGVESIIIRGNHDRAWPRADRDVHRLGPLVFHHGDRACELGAAETEIVGHLHPAVSWSDGAGLRLKFPALVHGLRRVVLPSFSDWAAGVSWNESLAEGETLWVVSPRKVWAVQRAGGS